MKVHNDLEDLLFDYTTSLLEMVESGNIDSYNHVKEFCLNNKLALGKPEPLAKNKQTQEVFNCILSMKIDGKWQQCNTQCKMCKPKNRANATSR